MKINGIMILHHLQKYFDIRYADVTRDIYVKTPVFYNVFFDMEEHIVLVHPEELDSCVRRVRQAVLICLSPPETIPPHPDNEIIVLEDSLSESMAFNLLIYIKEAFNEWEAKMNEVLNKRLDFQTMIEVISDFLDRSVALLDPNFRYIAYTVSSQKLMDMVDSHNYLPFDIANDLRNQDEFKNLEEYREAFVYTYGETVVYKNIFYDEQFVGRLSLLVDEYVDLEYAKTMFDCAGVFLEALYQQSSSFENSVYHRQKLHRFLIDIYATLPVDMEAFYQTMLENQSRLDDHWYIGLMISGNEGVFIYSASYVCRQMEDMIPGTFCVIKDGKIIVLYNESLFERKSGKDKGLTDALKQIADQFATYIFVSRMFSDISHLENVTAAMNQAQFAMDRGMRHPDEMREKRYRLFDEFALEFLLKKGAADFRVDQICHPAVLKLQEYDMIHETSFSRTLYTYVKEKYNAVAAARALYIHRSSFINRMDRIRELVDLDLDDLDNRLYILLSYRLIYGPDER
ncbi:MAG: helix-turn-helix domain-containing protein [Lachnospiraceae bacterium]|nr:helix-turn-helix domain-containing protein [Lachnospiraceae bacterium]